MRPRGVQTDLRTLVEEAEPQEHPRRLLVADPGEYRVEYVINPHMADANGAPHAIDPALARDQWEGLMDAYRDLGCDVRCIPGHPELPDQVFTANALFSDPRDGGRFVAARMAHEARAAEVPLAAKALEAEGYSEVCLPPGVGCHEGGGDLLWMPERRLILAGHGFRSHLPAVRAVGECLDAPVVPLELVDPRFYHLDTCLSPIDHETALWVPTAFTPEAQQAIRSLFGRLIEVPGPDAEKLAANAHSPDGRHVIIEQECLLTRRLLDLAGFDPVPVATGEFRKSGGSVSCLRQMFW